MALALRRLMKKRLVRKVINILAALDVAFQDCKSSSPRRRRKKKSPKIVAEPFASPNNGLIPSEKQPDKNPDLVFGMRAFVWGCSFDFFGAE